jgi:hypothetical protein
MDAALIGKLEDEIAGLEALLARKKAELDRLKSESFQSETRISRPQTINAANAPCSVPCFAAGKMYTPNALKAKKPENQAISRSARTNGPGFVRSRKLPVRPVFIVLMNL